MTERFIVSAVYDSPVQAEKTVEKLRDEGVRDEHISIVAYHGKPTFDHPDGSVKVLPADSKLSGAAKGLGIGASVGALFGLTALVVPGIGPFIAAGALAEALGTSTGFAVAGAIVGGTAGSIVGALVNYGFDPKEAEILNGRVRDGSILVVVNAGSRKSGERVEQVLRECGGQTPAPARGN